MLRLRGKTAQDVASRLHGELAELAARKLYLLPWNRFDLAGENTWWLVPSTENPAYAFGKLFCSNEERACESGEVRCGLHVEKGNEMGASHPSETMTANWEWHHFVLTLTSGTFAGALQAASEAVGSPLRIHIVASVDREQEEFSAEASGGRLMGVSTNLSPRVRAFHRLRGCATLSDLGNQLSGDVSRATEWGWIDVYVSSSFRLIDSGPDDIRRCVRMLNQFGPWI